MEFIENKLLSVEPVSQTLHHLTTTDSTIKPITVEWQKEKCGLLGIPYNRPIDQHSTLSGQKLQVYEPETCDDIGMDGNCLFRCLSKLVCGSEDYHAKIRGEISRYMLADGKDIIGWYFEQILTTTPAAHLSSKFMYQLGQWGTDAELMAASALLQTDIYVANKVYKPSNSIVSQIRWSLIRPSSSNSADFALYIANFHDHYQPVLKMIRSLTPTFSDDATIFLQVD